MLQDDAQDVVRAVLTAAKAGDMVAARLVLDRVLPPRRGRPVAIKLPVVHAAADLTVALGAIVAAVADTKSLTPEEGGAIAAVLETQRRAIETADLEDRIAALEQRRDGHR